MKKILSFLLLITFSCANAQQLDNKYLIFINEVVKFIDTVKPMSLYDGNNNVYYLKILSDKEDTNSYCFMIADLVNKHSYYDINPQYAFNIGDELVILDLNNYSYQSWFSEINYLPIDSIYQQKIINKLHRGFSDGHGEGLLFCYKKGTQNIRKFYNRPEEMSPQFQIHKPLGKGIIYKIDSPKSGLPPVVPDVPQGIRNPE